MEQNRRDFLKKSAIVGGAAWAAPAIATVSSAMAVTSQGPCACTACTGQATAAAVGPLTLGQQLVTGCTCVVITPTTLQPTLAADVACGKVDNNFCSASSYLANVKIQLAPTTFIHATALSSCVNCG